MKRLSKIGIIECVNGVNEYSTRVGTPDKPPEQIGHELLSHAKAIRDFSAVGKNVKGHGSFIVWSLDFDHAINGPMKTTQVAIQNWEDGKIFGSDP